MINSYSSSITELCIMSKDATHSQGCMFSLHNESDVINSSVVVVTADAVVAVDDVLNFLMLTQ